MQYEKQLSKIVDQLFRRTGEHTLTSLAEAAGLSYVTVWRLFNRVTVYPRLSTILALCEVVGLDMQLVEVKNARLTA